MADVVYSKIVEVLDNTQYIGALKKAEQEEKVLAGLREIGGKAAVKAYRDIEREQRRATAGTSAVVYSKIVEVLDNTQYIDALNKAEQEEKVLAGLREIGGKAAVKAYRDIEREQRRATAGTSAFSAAVMETATSSKATAAGMQQLSFQLDDVFTQLASGAAPMQVLVQQGGQIAGAFQSAPGLLGAVVDKVAALGPAIAATGAVLAPFIFLWKDYTDQKNAAVEADKRWQKVAKDGDNVIKDAAAKVRELNLELAPLTDQQRELERTSNRWKDATAAGTKEIDAQIRIVEAELKLLSKTSPEYAAQTELLEKLRRRRDEVTKAGKEGFEAERKLAQSRRESAEQDKAIEEAEKDREERRKKAKEAADKLRKAEYALGETERIAAENMGKMALEREEKERAALAALLKKTDAIEGLSNAEKSLSKREAQDQRDELARLTNIALATADTAEERVRIARETQEALAQIGQMEVVQARKDEDEKQKAAEEAARKRLEAEQKYLGAVADVTGAASDIFGVYYDSLTADTDSMTAEQKRTALKVWKTQQTLAIAEIGVNTIKGVSEALASAPPPLNLVPAAVAAAQGAAQLAAASSSPAPTFDDAALPPVRGGGRRTIAFHEDDYIAAAKDPIDLKRHAERVTSGRTSEPSTARRLAQINTGWLLTDQLMLTTRGFVR